MGLYEECYDIGQRKEILYTVGPQYEDKIKVSAKNENCGSLVQLPKKMYVNDGTSQS